MSYIRTVSPFASKQRDKGCLSCSQPLDIIIPADAPGGDRSLRAQSAALFWGNNQWDDKRSSKTKDAIASSYDTGDVWATLQPGSVRCCATIHTLPPLGLISSLGG